MRQSMSGTDMIQVGCLSVYQTVHSVNLGLSMGGRAFLRVHLRVIDETPSDIFPLVKVKVGMSYRYFHFYFILA